MFRNAGIPLLPEEGQHVNTQAQGLPATLASGHRTESAGHWAEVQLCSWPAFASGSQGFVSKVLGPGPQQVFRLAPATPGGK